MKKLSTLLMAMIFMAMAIPSGFAQEVTIRLRPGWNWIGYPYPDSVSVDTAFGALQPMEGDVIESFFEYSEYITGEGWIGDIEEFKPGCGYMYFSNRTETVSLVLGSSAVPPTVTTATPSGVSIYGITCGGEVTDTGSSGVLVRGVCWSTQQNPTINDPHTTDGYGTGSFSSEVEGLEMNTTYYMRAYAMTTSGTGYGEQVMFSTKNGVPVLTTLAASGIGTTWATCGGDISDDGGIEVTERGICWSTSHNPTIEGNHSSNGAGLGSFLVNMNNLQPNTNYYVRAYATNSHTTAYGNEISFHTEAVQTWQMGMLPGRFSVSASKRVRFSQGNLQYIGNAATPYWRFAEHQWDCLGTMTGQNSNGENVDRDLFGWGTSGYNHGANCYQQWSTATESSDYYAYGSYQYNLNNQTGKADWGYNPILNGGNTENNGWRTLTKDEWKYIFNTRSTSSGIRYAKAQVHGINGVILLPDGWNATIHALNYTNNAQASYNSNVIADSDWTTMETNGAVFLPAAGYRYGTAVVSVGSYGYYWSASFSSNSLSYLLNFLDSGLSPQSSNYRCCGHSVRLVRVVQ